ncbi:MAG: toll/interleukin-1 receptor domain-containing protein, partial [Leptolyngbyaceae bacterium]|nr:toll/interleukin-1 receptor domain-containing protein [Leptolyngbyaceae bacterium]
MENKQLPYDVFISHSSRDSLTASGMKQALQNKGIRCWKAPDDILPGESWPSAIMRAISGCRVMILVWTENAMSSSEVSKELTLAMRNNLVVVPYRIENVQPVGDWEYHLANTHWMDATSDIIDKDYHALGDFLLKLLPERGNAIDPPIRKLTSEDLEQFIEQALADGVLTEYERSQLMKDALSLGWKRDDFSAELEARLARKLQELGTQTPTPTPPKFSPPQSPPPPPIPQNANS